MLYPIFFESVNQNIGKIRRNLKIKPNKVKFSL